MGCEASSDGQVTDTSQSAIAGNPGIFLGDKYTITTGKTSSVQNTEVELLLDLKRLRKIAFALRLHREAL